MTMFPLHFHAGYGEYEVIVHIETGIAEDRFPERALRHLMAWCDFHEGRLLDNWERCRRNEASNSIDPPE